jgi:hypothetical protein
MDVIMARVMVHGEKFIDLITHAEGYVRAELKYDILKWLHAQTTAWWWPNANILSDAVIIDFDSEEDAVSFRLTWM